jgi:hypothetical protein
MQEQIDFGRGRNVVKRAHGEVETVNVTAGAG